MGKGTSADYAVPPASSVKATLFSPSLTVPYSTVALLLGPLGPPARYFNQQVKWGVFLFGKSVSYWLTA